MRIELFNFRCHVHTDIIIHDNSLVLLKGTSGCGKTTILQAILWCLYGSVRQVVPHEGSGKTSVKITMPNMTIERKKKPEILRLTMKPTQTNQPNQTNQGCQEFQEYQDKVAQQLIIQHFGTREVWTHCCYIQQNSRCALLSESNAERMDFLNRIAFSSDDPDVCVSRIETELKTVSAEYTSSNDLFVSIKNTLDDRLLITPFQITHILSLDELQVLKSRQVIVDSTLPLLEREVQEEQRRNTTFSLLSSELASISNQLLNLPVTNSPAQVTELELLIRNAECDVERIVRCKTLDEMIESLTDQLSRFSSLSDKSFNDVDLWKVKQEEAQFDTMLLKCKNLGIVIPSSCNLLEMVQASIDNLIAGLEDERQVLEQNATTQTLLIGTTKQRDALMGRITTLKTSHVSLLSSQTRTQTELLPYNNVNLTLEHEEEERLTLRNLELEYNNAMQARKYLKCPHCSGVVQLISQSSQLGNQLAQEIKLVAQDTQPVTQKECDSFIPNIQAAKDRINKLGIYRKKQSELNQQLALSKQQLVLIESEISSVNLLLSEVERQVNTYTSSGNKAPPVRTVSQIAIYLKELRSIVIVSKPENDSITIENTLTAAKLKSRISELIVELDRSQPLNPNVTSVYVKQLQAQLATLRNNLILQQHLIDRKNQTEAKLSTIVLDDSSELQLSKLKAERTELLIRCQQAEVANDLLEHKTQVEVMSLKLEEQNRSLTALYRLKDNAIRVECDRLNAVTASINLAMCEVFSYIFDDPIIVTLRLFKQPKAMSNKDQVTRPMGRESLPENQDKQNSNGKKMDEIRIKPAVNLQIQYKGTDCDSITHLSGGEGDRISLGLTLALNSICPSPLLLLDECCASLDAGLREACLKAIRYSSANCKTTLCVLHESVEGYYDETIAI